MNLPSTDAAKLIAILFRRRWGTEWSDTEVREFKKLSKAGFFEPLDDLMLVIAYYAAERKKSGDRGVHRRDLGTFLNRYRGELDRARAWAEKTGHQMASNEAAGTRPDPARWLEFLAKVYPTASVTDYYKVPGSVRDEFHKWRENQ